MTSSVSSPRRIARRGAVAKLEGEPGEAAALARALPLAQPQTLRGEAARAVLQGWAPEVLVVVAYGLLLPREILALPRYGCLNIHASLLPRWRGAAPDPARDPRRRLRNRRHASCRWIRAWIPARCSRAPCCRLSAGRQRRSCTTPWRCSVPRRCSRRSPRLAAGSVTPVPQPPEGVTYAAEDREERRPASTGARTLRRSTAGAGVQSLARGRDHPRWGAVADLRRAPER